MAQCLSVIDYIIHSGSEKLIRYFRDNLYIISTLKEFQHIDPDGYDRGSNVRSKAKVLTALLLDDVRLRAARRVRSGILDRPWPESRYDDELYLGDGPPRRARRRWNDDCDSDEECVPRRRRPSIEDDIDLKDRKERLLEKSIAERKRALALEKLIHEEAELATAKQLREEVEAKRAKTQEEEAKRKMVLQEENVKRKLLGDTNAMTLLDDHQQLYVGRPAINEACAKFHPFRRSPNSLVSSLPEPFSLFQQQQALQVSFALC
jgi:epsin